jgi:TolB-like protein
MSGDAEQEYFVDGMVEDITTALSRIKWLFVIARNSAFVYRVQPARTDWHRRRKPLWPAS